MLRTSENPGKQKFNYREPSPPEVGLPRTPPYLYVWSSRYISWMMPKGVEDGLRISRPEMAVEELPLGPLCEETLTAYRDRRR